MNIDKIKNQLPISVFNHIVNSSKDKLELQKSELIKDLELIGQPGYFTGNCNDLYYMRNLELKLIDYMLS
jgi:hypothetical protein